MQTFLLIVVTLTGLFFHEVKPQVIKLAEAVSAPWQMSFQYPKTPVMEGIINFHDKAMCLITFIVFAVGYIFCLFW